jgi:SagB-type dehydrogenase family enzyme
MCSVHRTRGGKGRSSVRRGGGDELRYRRSPHLVFYWNGPSLIAFNYATRSRVAARPVVCEIIHFFDQWRSAEQLFEANAHLHRADLRKILALMVKRSLLHREHHAASDRERAMATWADWNPEAGFFHNATKDLHYGDLRTIERLTREKERVSPMPASVKRYAKARVVSLPPAQTGGPFLDTLLTRRTWRRFGKNPVSVSAFSTLLGLTAGVQGWLPAHSGQHVALKTSPSGGARHPIELYVLVRRVDGLARGLYHYACDRHALELVDGRGHSRPVERYLPTQTWYAGASALVFLTAVFERVQWRYTHPRAYRAALIEAGHLCQTFCLTATWLGLAPFCSMALADTRIEEDLKLDGITESVLYVAGVGTRPAAVAWTPSQPAGGRPAPLTSAATRRFPGLVTRPRR